MDYLYGAAGNFSDIKIVGLFRDLRKRGDIYVMFMLKESLKQTLSNGKN